MNWVTVGTIVLLWWNTSLSPPVSKKKATRDDVTFVATQIKQMRAELEFDVLALGEVSTDDLEIIMNTLNDSYLSVHDATDRRQKPMFDTAIIYDRRKLDFVEHQSIVDAYGRTKLKTGEMIVLMSQDTGDSIYLVISHWPSRRTANEFESRRGELGTSLRMSLKRLRDGEPKSHIILMGDYNDDPFSPSLAQHLLATRDRQLAKQDDRFLYNPFWRLIGESLPEGNLRSEDSICGTHFYHGGEHGRWFTFDQIIFSSAFLSDGALVLDEQHSRIVSSKELNDRLRNRREIFDHFPVLSAVTLRSMQ